MVNLNKIGTFDYCLIIIYLYIDKKIFTNDPLVLSPIFNIIGYPQVFFHSDSIYTKLIHRTDGIILTDRLFQEILQPL